MRFFWGRIVGSLVGAFGGPLGIGFGFLVGYLADLLISDYQVKKEAQLFLVNSSEDLRWVGPMELLVVGILVGSSTVTISSARAIAAEIGPLLRRRSRFSRWQRNPLEPIVDVALRLGDSIDREHLFAFAVEHLPTSDRITILTICSSLVRGDGEFREIAGSLDVNPTVLSELFRTRHHDLEACAVLGVAADASSEEIKHTYRRLAAQFHPDTAAGLSPQQQDASAQAFVKIRQAYERLTGAGEN